jgi:hypothetical protein
MKFSLASIPLAILASTAAAQGPPPNGAQQWGIQQQQYPVQPYQPPQQQYCYCPPQQCTGCIGVTPRQYPQLSDLEVAAWIGCTTDWLSALNSNSKGDGPACQFYNCLQKVATQYRAGGPIVIIGKPLGLACSVGSMVTDGVGGIFHGITGGLVR